MFPRSPGIWFFSDDFGVSANVGYQGFDGSRNTNCGVGASWRFTGSPFTLNAGYENYGGDADLAAWGVGLTWNFGADSVRAESQSGAGWDGARRTYQDLLGGF